MRTGICSSGVRKVHWHINGAYVCITENDVQYFRVMYSMWPPKPDNKQQQRLGTDSRAIIVFIFCSCYRFAWTTTCLGLVNCLQCTISALIIKLYRCGRKVYADIFMNFIAKVFVLYWRFLRRYILMFLNFLCCHVETSGVHCYMHVYNMYVSLSPYTVFMHVLLTVLWKAHACKSLCLLSFEKCHFIC